ncbi:transmembrane emp24 domain-containing protein p24delta9-like [Dioscorea cayenensis subsp. rotundata]|uniref:Transmembrane emp24 domain-containing protein p24delta9-like n=1 Tax=Dioscorea cayennensis subsp. rotundata TaxID=55577 RepID=A0AB40BLM9_DIOCR|nr:transmembrane emp24 domain-containing protein p24delta9-like [Dioscorea cayenensis subsp. rotundata]
MAAASAAFLQVTILLLILLLISVADALVLHLPSGRVKCFSEELRPGAVSTASYRVVSDEDTLSGADRKISLRVTGPDGEPLHVAEAVESGRFGFVADEAGTYMACLWSPRFELSGTVTVDFEWRAGITAKEWPSIAKRSKIQGLEIELKKLEDSIKSIHEEMIYLRQREGEAQSLNESTNSKMGLLSMASLLVCLGVAGLQFWHLKVFFVRQKIL